MILPDREMWTQAFLNGKEIKGYEVSTFGQIRSYWKQTNGQYVQTNEYRTVSISNKKGYRYAHIAAKAIKAKKPIAVSVHRVVMDSFRPITKEKLAPEGLAQKEWENAPDAVRLYIGGLLEVDHCNCDTSDNNINNLSRRTPKGNVNAALKKYKGNHKNKKYLNRKTKFALIDPEGNLHRGSGLNTFCKKYCLDTPSIRKVLSGERTSHKGWKRANDWYVNNKIQDKPHSVV
jgi:hypothetical protein